MICLRVLLCLMWSICTVDGATFSEMLSLYNTLTNGVNKNLRPNTNYDQATNISIGFTILNLQDIDEVNGVMSVAGYFTVSWKDENLVWPPSSYNNIKSITLPYDVIWRPPLMNANTAKEFKTFGLEDTFLQLNYDGEVTWLPGENLNFLCDIDTTYFPFDTQKCEFIIKVWGFPDEEIVITPIHSTMNTDMYQSNSEWDLTQTLIYSDKTQIPKVRFKLFYKRRPLFLLTTLVIPSIFLALLNICVFLLPQDTGERIGFSITLLLAVVVFMTIAQGLLPATAVPRLSAICTILLIDMVMSGMIVASVIVSAWFYYRPECELVPNWIRTIILLKQNACKDKSGNEISDANIGQKEKLSQAWIELEKENKVTWQTVASFWDSMSFIFYIVCFIVGNLAFILDIVTGA